MAKDDVSKKTILILLVLTLVVSVVGTVTVLEMASKAPTDVNIVGPSDKGDAKVSLEIIQPAPEPAPVEPKDAEVSLEILPAEQPVEAEAVLEPAPVEPEAVEGTENPTE
ncbi:hypothetical protein HN587_04065 [Candidatus Woesearchaeota archaeon]|jgi:hypothetical protein|nr:hypothetical protein [Candidatus Woesearchaeota archaeon]